MIAPVLRPPLRLLLAALVLLGSATAASAAPITVPSGLSPGDQYRLAFVTAGLTDAHPTDIAYYNAFVSAAAAAVPALNALGTTWKAIASTSAIDARDNTNTNPTVETGLPIYLLNDEIIATDNAALWDGGIDFPLWIDENGIARTVFVWTGTTPSGVGAGATGVLGGTDPAAGDPVFNNSEWIFAGFVPYEGEPYGIYALSGPLTVVPEPGIASLAAIVLGVLFLSRPGSPVV